MGERQPFLQAIEEASKEQQYGGLHAFLKRNNARTDSFVLAELLQGFSGKDNEHVWRGVLAFVRPIVEERRYLRGDEDESDDEEEDEDGGDVEKYDGEEEESTPRGGPSAASRGANAVADAASDREIERRVTTSLEALSAAATLAQIYLADASRAAPPSLLATLQLLHGALLFLDAGGLQGAAVQLAVARCCEAFWHGERPGAELLVAQLVPYALLRALGQDSREADVKRVHSLRGALLLLDVDDADGASLRQLLLRAFLSPLFLRCGEGRKFLTALLGLGPSLVEDIHAAVRGQIPGGRRAALKAYGDVYFRAWGAADGAVRAKLESACIQDLMQACVHASSPSLHASLLVVLEPFHDRRRRSGKSSVDGALARLYDPILWRALRCANPVVRTQACGCLAAAFPLQDPTAGAAAVDTALQRQFNAFRELLEDGSPAVRSAAGGAVCGALSAYWEAVPIATTRALLARVAGQLACDASSAAVRLAAAKGLRALLPCPAALPVVRAMLPGVANLLHDVHPKVRLAFVQLLADVKARTPAITAGGSGGPAVPAAGAAAAFSHPVPMPRLLGQLAAEAAPHGGSGGAGGSAAVASALIGLVLEDFYPHGAGITGAMQASRCLALLARDPAAARAFCSGLHVHVPVGNVVKLAAVLMECVVVAVENDETESAASASGRAAEPAPAPVHGGLGVAAQKTQNTAEAAAAAAEEGSGGGGKGKRGSKKRGKTGSKKRAAARVKDENVDEAAATAADAAAAAAAAAKPSSRKRREMEASSDTDEELVAVAAASADPERGGSGGKATGRRLSASDLPLMEGILTLVALLWESVAASLTETANAACQELLATAAPPALLRQLYNRFRGTEGTRAAVLRVAALAGDGAAPVLLGDVVTELLAVPADTPAARLAPVAALLCAWGQQEQLVAVVVASLDAAFGLAGSRGNDGGNGNNAAGRNSEKRQRPALPPEVAVLLLSLVLAGSEGGLLGARDVLLADKIATRRVCRALEGARRAVDVQLGAAAAQEASAAVTGGCSSSAKLLAGAVGVLGRLFMHQAVTAAAAGEGSDDDDDAGGEGAEGGASAGMSALLEWARDTVLPAITPQAEEEEEGAADCNAVGLAVLEQLILLASDCAALGQPALPEAVDLADACGRRLLSPLLQTQASYSEAEAAADEGERDGCGSSATTNASLASTMLPALAPGLCRLAYQLTAGDARVAAVDCPLWSALLEGAKVSSEVEACVGRLVAASLALSGRRGDLEEQVDVLLAFLHEQSTVISKGAASGSNGGSGRDHASSDEEKSGEADEGEEAAAASLRLLTLAPQAPKQLRLTTAGAVVLRALLRSAAAAQAALAACTRRLGSGGSSGEGGNAASTDIFCVFLLAALVASAPAKAATTTAVAAHKLLAQHPACANGGNAGVSMTGEDSGGGGGGSTIGEDSAFDTATAVKILYARLEAAKRAATQRPRATSTSAGAGSAEGAVAAQAVA